MEIKDEVTKFSYWLSQTVAGFDVLIRLMSSQQTIYQMQNTRISGLLRVRPMATARIDFSHLWRIDACNRLDASLLRQSRSLLDTTALPGGLALLRGPACIRKRKCPELDVHQIGVRPRKRIYGAAVI